MTGGQRTGPLTHGLAARPATGENQSGDRSVVAATGNGVLVAVIDGLGHGPDAAVAAAAAADVLNARADGEPVELLARCHEALRPTRGAAISLAVVTGAGRLDWVAVGNVQGVVAHAASGATSRLVTRGGVAGRRLPPLRASSVALADDDLLILYTDGVDEAAARDLPLPGGPDAIAEQLLQRHARGNDDALVLVARYREQQP